jgi:hypothetical protein
MLVKEAQFDDEKPVEEILLAQQNPLALAEECLQREDAALFYAHLNHGLKDYLSKKLSIPAEELNRKNITEQLDKKGISNETVVQLQGLMDEIEWQLYTPFADKEKMKGLFDKASDLVQLMNTYHP